MHKKLLNAERQLKLEQEEAARVQAVREALIAEREKAKTQRKAKYENSVAKVNKQLQERLDVVDKKFKDFLKNL